MSREQFEKAWSLPAFLLLFYALNIWLSTQGALPIFNVKIHTQQLIPEAFLGILICAPLFTLLCLVGILCQRRHRTTVSFRRVRVDEKIFLVPGIFL